MSACISTQWKTLGGTVSSFKLQKHESSFERALFTALIWCAVVQSSVCTACFPKMLGNQQRFHWHATKWHRQYSFCCYGYSSHLHDCFLEKSWLHTFSQIAQLCEQCRKNLLFVHFFFSSSSSLTTWAKATFSKQHEFQIKEAEDDKI